MSILQRIATLTKAALHEGLNKLEDPVLLTGQYLRDLETEITTAENKQRDLQVAANVLERRIHEYRLLAERSEAEAITAVQQGNDEAARVAVLAKLRYTESGQECTAGLEETRQTLAALEISIHSAKEEHARLKEKRAELAARARKAAEKKNLAAASSKQGLNAGSCGQPLNAGAAARGFERMEDKITEWEVLAESSSQPFHTTGNNVSQNLDPALSSAVEAELDRLRNRKTDLGK